MAQPYKRLSYRFEAAGDLSPMTDFSGERNIDEVAAACGEALALKLIEAFPGAELRIPHKVDEGHALARKLGLQEARTLCAFAGGSSGFYIPFSRYTPETRARKVCQLAEDGKLSRKEIALAVGISQRSVRRILQRFGLTNEHGKHNPTKDQLTRRSNAPLTPRLKISGVLTYCGAKTRSSGLPAIIHAYCTIPTMEYHL